MVLPKQMAEQLSIEVTVKNVTNGAGAAGGGGSSILFV